MLTLIYSKEQSIHTMMYINKKMNNKQKPLLVGLFKGPQVLTERQRDEINFFNL